MHIITAILDLAKSMEPARDNVPVKFNLTFDGKEWTARVDMVVYFLDAKGKTDDEALKNLHTALVNYNKTILKKISDRIKCWANSAFGLAKPS